MRKIQIVLILFIAVAVMACSSDGEKKNISTEVVTNTKTAGNDKGKVRAPHIKFKEKTYDFGKVLQGEVVKHSFSFTNTGDMTLLVTNVRSSCGCTVSDYSKKPISPGGSGKIEVSFNSHRRKGMQNKSITVTSNSIPNTTTLHIKANVVLPEEN